MQILTSPLLDNAGFEHGFTTREGGSSTGPFGSLNVAFDVGDDSASVARNMSLLEAEVAGGLPLARVEQVHGLTPIEAEHAVLSGWTEKPRTGGDGILSGSTHAVLAVQTADCAAVLLADPTSGNVAAVHAGWRGTAGGVIRNTIRKLQHRGVETGSLLAAVGPCICFKCYEVGDDVASRLPESAEPVRKKHGHYLLDLANAIEVSLIGAGMTSTNIERIDGCTRCEPERFFSYRGSGGECGRNLGFISSKRK